MKATHTQQGRVVVSLKGHDKGRWYTVLSVIDDQTVLICDGNFRTLKKPKKKRIKHLSALPLTILVSGQGRSGGEMDNSDIRYQLKNARDAYQSVTSSASAQCKKEECAFVQE